MILYRKDFFLTFTIIHRFILDNLIDKWDEIQDENYDDEDSSSPPTNTGDSSTKTL